MSLTGRGNFLRFQNWRLDSLHFLILPEENQDLSFIHIFNNESQVFYC